MFTILKQIRGPVSHLSRQVLYFLIRVYNIFILWVENSEASKVEVLIMVGRYQAGVCAFNGLVYAVGGCNTWNCLNTVECYDFQTDKWTFTKPLVTARRGCGLIVFNSKYSSVYYCLQRKNEEAIWKLKLKIWRNNIFS